MKHSKIDTKNFKRKKWKNNEAKSKEDKYALTIEEYRKLL